MYTDVKQRSNGDRFILDIPTDTAPLWGDGSDVLWQSGEGLLIAGQQGTGKTTLVLQIVLSRIGVRPSKLLGHSVARTENQVLYIAADRPLQIARNARRMVTEEDRELLSKHLVVWRGPVPFDLNREPGASQAGSKGRAR